MMKEILQDWEANRGNIRSQLILAFFRLAQRCYHLPESNRWLGWPILALYEILVVWVQGVELSYKARIGPGLRLYHGTALVVHEAVLIGSHCTLRHCTTLGMRREAADCPVIGDHVDIGSNSVLIGRINIGDRAIIGAGSVVLHDVPPGAVAAGNPAKIIRQTP